ncbi:MAG: FAD-binding protein [Candidatus Edwardsbacteria bacterium]|nr:FAD-binding protein [Candidatus Edwardsbacteria bacterium]MBU1577202.1 FAD-binding protein [Candidatus Edwardsbacteria bacterium]MBU2463723.1 FAD-binding protein [Candidatus Edwardsbacteria bacterium]MBU2594103.1 FAD-binding protein [Candidatus Edwardsbacteria bacterium]
MPYTPELKQLIKKVEATRPERVRRKKEGQEMPAMSLEERQAVLDAFHPDCKKTSKRPIGVGVNKGYAISPEIVDQLEAKSRVNPDKVDLNPRFTTDVLVVGGGGAGVAAAIMAKEHGAKVLILTKLRVGDANTMMAEGGIQSSSKLHKDSPYYHYLDVLGGGHFKNVPELAEALVGDAPETLAWLESLGCMFTKYPDGRLLTIHGGGTCRKRMHYAADITGAEIMRTLRDEALNFPEDIKGIDFTSAVELILNDKGQCAGVVAYNHETEEYFTIKAKAVIMATGGSGRLHIQNFMTTNHYGATGDGLVMGYRAGVELNFLHTVQFHPTGVSFPDQIEGLLLTEKFRGMGANILNIDAEQFVFEREPRDVEAAAFIRECEERKKGVATPSGKVGVWLDSPMIDDLKGKGTVEKEFVGKWKLYMRHDIDISKEPMLTYPTLHYQNGGLKINARSETSLPGLYAAGEVAGGIHGENRLMGNSLLDVCVFGRRAGQFAAEYIKTTAKDGKLSLEHVKKYHKELEAAGIGGERVSPMLLPDYSNPEVRKNQITTCYLGNIR